MGDTSSLQIIELIDEIRMRFGSAGLDRIEDMLRIKAGIKEVRTAPFQQSHCLHIPRLPSKPWYEAKQFPWYQAVKSVIPNLRSELADLLDNGDSKPFAEDTMHSRTEAESSPITWPATLKDWIVFPLYKHGSWHQRNCSLSPTAKHLVELTPFAPGEGCWSILESGGRIQMHSSGCNAVLTCHAPLVVPDDCALQVATEQRLWVEDEPIVFDDSFLHRAWNNASTKRIVLLWEIWHPQLTDEERAALEIVYPRMMNFTE